MRGLDARRAPAAPRAPPRTPGATTSTFCHASAAPLRSCLPKARTMPMLSSVLAWLGIDDERSIELRQRLVRLVHVVVGDAEVGAGVDVLRIDLQRRLVPLGRFLEPAGVEVHVAELHARDRVGRILLRGRLHRGRARLVERRRRLRARPARPWLGAAGGRRRRRGPAGALLAADNPADQDAEEHARPRP